MIGLDSCTRWLTGSSLRHYSVLVFARIHLHRRTQPPNEWLHGSVFISLHGHFARSTHRLAGFLVVDLLSHHIIPQGRGGVYMCAGRGSTSSSSTSSRFCFTPYVFWLAGLFVFLKYPFKNARKYTNAPDLLREIEGEGDGNGDGGTQTWLAEARRPQPRRTEPAAKIGEPTQESEGRRPEERWAPTQGLAFRYFMRHIF